MFDVAFWDTTQYNVFDICQNFEEMCALIYRKHENNIQRDTHSRRPHAYELYSLL
jgi:hypothetical protein